MTTAALELLRAHVAGPPPEWQGIAAENAQAISDGETAMQVHRRGIDRIFAIGRAFEILQSEAMLRSHSNNPIGKRYNEAYAAITKPAPELTKVNKTDRNQYIWCWQNHNEVAVWWGTVAQNQRDRWGHPDSVKRHYLSAYGSDKTATTKPGGTDAPKETLKQANMRLREENDALRKRLERAADTVTEGTDRELEAAQEHIRELDAAIANLKEERRDRLFDLEWDPVERFAQLICELSSERLGELETAWNELATAQEDMDKSSVDRLNELARLSREAESQKNSQKKDEPEEVIPAWVDDLTMHQIRAARRKGGKASSYKALAAQHGLTYQQVKAICDGKRHRAADALRRDD